MCMGILSIDFVGASRTPLISEVRCTCTDQLDGLCVDEWGHSPPLPPPSLPKSTCHWKMVRYYFMSTSMSMWWGRWISIHELYWSLRLFKSVTPLPPQNLHLFSVPFINSKTQASACFCTLCLSSYSFLKVLLSLYVCGLFTYIK